MRTCRSRWFHPNAVRDDRGIAAVEFALIAPVFITLVFGIMVYSLYITTKFAVIEAAAEAARASVAGGSDSERSSLALARAKNVIAAYNPLVSWPHVSSFTATAGSTVGTFKVTIVYDNTSLGLGSFSKLIPLPSATSTGSAIVSNGGY